MTTRIQMLVLLLALLAPLSVGAEEPGDEVVRTADGKLKVTTVYLAPSSCHSAGTAVPGAPVDAITIDNAILITQPLKHSGDQVCLWMMKPVTFAITAEVPKGAQAIVIYTVNEETKSVTARALAIPNP
jgi:hypothetical protein